MQPSQSNLPLPFRYAEIEVKTADPCVSFSETVVETSSLKCFAETPNKKNKLTMIAEPLDKGMAEAIESGSLSLGQGARVLAQQLQTNFNWDVLAARWALCVVAVGAGVIGGAGLSGHMGRRRRAATCCSMTRCPLRCTGAQGLHTRTRRP